MNRKKLSSDERFQKQIEFMLEIDRLKHIKRMSILRNGSRRENSAEHSWHIALSVLIFSEYARESEIDRCRVIQMLLLHDLVEIDAGDTYCYDATGRRDQSQREAEAADRIFGLLPGDQARDMKALWEEFEAKQTPEAQFAHALDRVQPLLLNYVTEGHTWQENQVHKAQVTARMRPVEKGSPFLWQYVASLIDKAVAKGYLAP